MWLSNLNKPALVGRGTDDQPGTLLRRKISIVEKITVEGNQRPPELARMLVVVGVASATQVVVFEHEEHVPVQRAAHHLDGSQRQVRVDVDTRRAGDVTGNWTKFRGECAHRPRGLVTSAVELLNLQL